MEAIRARFEQECGKRGQDPVVLLQAFLGPEAHTEAFWQQVKVNLQAGRIRMVFVADLIPPELRRIVEFLNGQMDPAEVLAVEIKQFAGQGLKTLVPRVIGQTTEAERKKGGSGTAEKQWDEVSFFEELLKQEGDKDVATARSILDWAKKSVTRVWWGKGSVYGSFFPMLYYKGENHFTVSVWTYGTIEIQFQWMLPRKPFDDESKRQELRERLNRIPGIAIPADAIKRRPSIPLAVLTDDAALMAFLTVLDWYVAEVKAV